MDFAEKAETRPRDGSLSYVTSLIWYYEGLRNFLIVLPGDIVNFHQPIFHVIVFAHISTREVSAAGINLTKVFARLIHKLNRTEGMFNLIYIFAQLNADDEHSFSRFIRSF